DRPLFVLQTGARTANGIRDRFHSLILTDHTFVEFSFQMHQLLALTLQHFSYRNAGPARDNFSDIFTFYFFLQHGAPFLDFSQLGLRFFQVRFQLVDGTIPKLGYLFVVTLAFGLFCFITRGFDGLFEIACFLDELSFLIPLRLHSVALLFQIRQLFINALDLGFGIVALQGFAFNLQLAYLSLNAVQFFGHRVDLQAQPRGCLINQVDSLIGQKALGDVTVRQLGRADDRTVSDTYTVMQFISLLEPAQDGNSIFHGGFLDHYGLEASFQRFVLLDIFAVFGQRGGADGMQFAAGQRWFQDICGVHRSFRGAGADQRMNLINKENNLSVGVLHF